jgi:monoamine oxidase
MPRTPLFREVVRTLRLARHSLHTGIGPDELVEIGRERAISRRRFVGVSAAATAGLLLGGCAPALRGPRPGEEPVLIVGAGIAGLTAGHRLRQAGVPVRIMEAQERVGGRMYSLRDFFADGQVAELGGELIDTGHVRIRALACELGIELDDLAADDPALARDVWFFDGRRYTDAELVAAFRPVAARIEADLAALGGDGDVTYRQPNGGEALDRTTVAEWLDRAGVTGWMRELLDVAYTTEYGLETDRQSALNFLLMIDPEPEPFRVFGDSDERFHVRGGNDRIPHALAAGLSDAIETGSVLEAVRARGDGGFVASFRRGGSSFEVGAQHLVLAIPFTLLREVRLDVPLPEPKRRAIRELGYGTNAKLMVGFSERVWRTRHGSNGSVLTDLPFQLTWETSRLQPGRAGILTNFTGGEHGVEIGRGTPAEQAAVLVRGLERVFPGAAAARAGMREARFHWPSHPWTRGSYASYLPGQWTAFRGAEGESVGRLYFAGEHCSLEAQGFMEGGCETGEAAAREVLASLGTPAWAETAACAVPDEAAA